MNKKIYLFQACILTLLFILFNSIKAQKLSVQRKNIGKEYTALNAKLTQGWNTWNTRSVLSYVFLPNCFGIDLQLINHQSGDTLKEALIAREEFGSKEHVIPGPHAYDGSYTELVVEWQGISVRVQSAAKNEKFYLLITPIRQMPGDSVLIIPQMFWDKQGEITLINNTILVNTPSGKMNLVVVGGQYKTTVRNLKASLRGVIALSTDSLQSTERIQKIINDSKAKAISEKIKYKDAKRL